MTALKTSGDDQIKSLQTRIDTLSGMYAKSQLDIVTSDNTITALKKSNDDLDIQVVSLKANITDNRRISEMLTEPYNFIGTYSVKWKGNDKGTVTITPQLDDNKYNDVTRYNISVVDGSQFVTELMVDARFRWFVSVPDSRDLGLPPNLRQPLPPNATYNVRSGRAVIKNGIVDTIGTEYGDVLIKRL